MPATSLEPTGEPAQGQQTSDEGEHHSKEADSDGSMQAEGGIGSSGLVSRFEEAQCLVADYCRCEDDGEGEAEGFGGFTGELRTSCRPR